jgi:hypothetical protein
MRAVEIIALQKRIYLALQSRNVIGLVPVPTQALGPHGFVESLNGGLLVLLVWTTDPVARTELSHMSQELDSKLASTIGLYQGHKTAKAKR